LPQARYTIDTSSFIRIEELDGANVLRIWDRLLGPSLAGRLRICEQVLRELSRKDQSEAYRQVLSARDAVLIPPDVQDGTELQRLHDDVWSRFPRMSRPNRGESRADPWIIALARLEQLIVVTEEARRGNRMPAACAFYGVECITLEKLIRREGLT